MKPDFQGLNKSLGSPQILTPTPLSLRGCLIPVYSHRCSQRAWVQIPALSSVSSVTSGNLLNCKMGMLAIPIFKGCQEE